MAKARKVPIRSFSENDLVRRRVVQRSFLRHRALLTAAVFFVAVGSDFCRADPADWATGAALDEKLASPTDVLWSDTPLRQAVESLSRVKKVALLLDRRVDPGQRLSVTIHQMPLAQALQTMAQQCNLGIARVGAVLYLGPKPAAQRLRAVVSHLESNVRRLSPRLQRIFRRAERLAWADFAAPRDLLMELAEKNRLTIVNPDRVPHDLWAAADLPALPLTERLALIVFQYDLTFRIAAEGRIELALLPAEAASDEPASSSAPVVSTPRAARNLPEIGKLRIDKISVREKPLETVLEQLAERLYLEVRYDRKTIEAAGISLTQRVSLHVENATLDDLLRELLTPTGLTYVRRQRTIEVMPATSGSPREGQKR